MAECLVAHGNQSGERAVPRARTPGTVHESVVADSWLRVGCETVRPGIVVCTVAGGIDAGNLHVLERALGGMEADAQVRSVVVDLSEMQFLAIGGAEALLAAAGSAAVAQREFVAVVSTRGVRRSFESTGAECVIPWYATRTDALEAVRAWTWGAVVTPPYAQAG